VYVAAVTCRSCKIRLGLSATRQRYMCGRAKRGEGYISMIVSTGGLNWERPEAMMLGRRLFFGVTGKCEALLPLASGSMPINGGHQTAFQTSNNNSTSFSRLTTLVAVVPYRAIFVRPGRPGDLTRRAFRSNRISPHAPPETRVRQNRCYYLEAPQQRCSLMRTSIKILQYLPSHVH
jgi:hypothetical protein